MSIEKRKAELREYIEARKPTVKIKLPGTYDEIDLRHAETIKSALIAEQLLECIEALEKYKDACFEVQGKLYKIGAPAEKLLNKIAGGE